MSYSHSRADLRRILTRAGATPAPCPDPAFVASLEHHLLGQWERTGATRRARSSVVSRADLRRLLVAVGSVETPAPSPAFVDAVEEGILRDWAPTSRRRVAPARPSRARRVAIASAVAAAAAVAASAFVVLPHEGTPAVESVRVGDNKKEVTGDGNYRVTDKQSDEELVFTFEDGRTYRSKEGEFRVRDGNLYVPTEDGDGYQVVVPDEPLVAGPPDPSSPDEPAAVASVELAPETTTTTTTTPPSTEPPPTSTTTLPPEAPPAP
jgi:hypothetical protein